MKNPSMKNFCFQEISSNNETQGENAMISSV